MAYTLTTNLDAGATGLTLAAKIIDTTGADVGTEITTGFVEVGSNQYLFTSSAIPDGHRGAIKFYVSGTPGTILATVAINPQEAEYLDAKLSTQIGTIAASVWAAGTRSLTTFGTLVSDTASAAATAVWEIATSGLTTAGTIGKRIVDYLTGDAFARLGAPSGASISADVASVKSDASTMLGRLTSIRAGYLDLLAGFSIANVAAAVWNYLTSAATTVGSLGKLMVDNLNATVSSRSSHAASDVATAVWASVSRTLTSSGALTADDIVSIVNGVWDGLLADHDTASTMGAAVNDIVTHVTSQGTGSVTVNHNYGSAGALTFETSGGIGIQGKVRAYAGESTTNFAVANKRGQTDTNDSGEWVTPMLLDPGTYTLVYSDADENRVTTTNLTVT